MIYKCIYCNYSTMKKYNLDRHCDNKHLAEISYNEYLNELANSQQTQNIKKEEKEKFYCSKCYKEYLSTKTLQQHEEKCSGIDIMTCPTCMTTFAHYQSKYRHMKRNNCKPKSQLHYQNPNIANMINSNNTNTYNTTNNTNNNTTNNNTTNNTNCHNNTYNIIINDFGKERTDYITLDKLIDILRSNNIVPNYIDIKHFNKNFPENRNIKYENNICYIRKQEKWQPITMEKLSSTLLQTNTNELANKYKNEKEAIENIIQNIDVMEYIEKRFDYLDLMTNKNKYKDALNDIKCLIKSNKT